MSSEIVVPETPNWLQELEAKRERRLKVRLGHEAGAGAPCLKCGEKCPGLDLHFWRKCCKICKCAKEEHEVQDDDIYGWAQFQLLGNKPNKIKRKIVLPGKKDEVELDWIPKGHNETVDKYLKTLPPDQLPVKGSQAAQDRKQLLQKQIPIHDIDPTLCHELSNEELEQMNNYVSHVKQTSVGVGQIVSLSNIIKANLHMLNPSEAALIASRYPKGIPLSEIVKLQAQNKANALNRHLDKLSLQDPSHKNLLSFVPNSVNTTEENLEPWVSSKINDINYYPGYGNDINQPLQNVPFPNKFKPLSSDLDPNAPGNMPTLDEMFMQNPNFDPKKVPSQFVNQNVGYGQAYPYKIGSENVPYEEASHYKPAEDPAYNNSAFAPYNKVSSSVKPGEKYYNENPLRSLNYSSNLSTRGTKSPIGSRPGEIAHQNISQKLDKPYVENVESVDPNFVKNLSKFPSGYKNRNEEGYKVETSEANPSNYGVPYENVEEMKKNNKPGLPTYIPGKYNVVSETLSPTKIPKNVKDLAFSTHNPNEANYQNLQGVPPYDVPTDNYQGNYPAYNAPYNAINKPYDQNKPGQYLDDIPKQNHESNVPYPAGGSPTSGDNKSLPYADLVFSQNSSGLRPGQSARLNSPLKTPKTVLGDVYGQNVPYGEYPYSNIPSQTRDSKANKKLSELQPGNINIEEDYLQPSQVTIGAIQDINYPEIKAATQGTNDFYEDYSPDSLREILNNVKLPDCHYCKKPFEENEFAITIDRANVLFHAQCFKCAGCNQILADNVYFYNKETDNVYCGRDYAKIRGFPRCKACDELIFTKEYCLAENSTFHLKHFCCIECDRPLAGQDYTLEDEMPYCLPCFEQSKASKCSSCNRVIKPDEVGCNLNGVHFHAVDECFACKMCKKPLMGKKLLLRNGKLYCSHDCFGSDKL